MKTPGPGQSLREGGDPAVSRVAQDPARVLLVQDAADEFLDALFLYVSNGAMPEDKPDVRDSLFALMKKMREAHLRDDNVVFSPEYDR